MVLTDWIMQFNESMAHNKFPFDKLLVEYDSADAGGLSMKSFKELNARLEVSLAGQELEKVFEIIDRDRNGVLTLTEIR